MLMNIALHGMENELLRKFPRDGIKVIRYADDFVITSQRLDYIKKARDLVSSFLDTIGLKLSNEKTNVGHSMN